jgi:hypothetical protein
MDSTRASGRIPVLTLTKIIILERATFDAMAAHCSIRCTAYNQYRFVHDQVHARMHVRTDRPISDPIAIHAQLATPLLVITRAVCVRWEQRQVFSWASALNQQTLWKPPWSLRALRVVCLHLRQPANHPVRLRAELPATCLHITNLRVISGWLATAASAGGRRAPYVAPAAPAAGALTSTMFSAIWLPWTAFCKLCVNRFPQQGRPRPWCNFGQSTSLGGVFVAGKFLSHERAGAVVRCP